MGKRNKMRERERERFNDLPTIIKEVCYVNIKNKTIICHCYIHKILMDTLLKPMKLQHLPVT